MSHKNENSGRLIIGIAIVLIGFLLLSRNVGFFNFSIPHYIFSWSSILVIVGIVLLVNRENKLPGVLFIVGAFIGYQVGFWPMLLLGVGAYLLLEKKMSSKRKFNFDGNTESSKNYFSDISIFGGGRKTFATNNFQGGSSLSIFGGSEIHLTNCDIQESDVEIEITAFFGGTSLIVPKDWNVVIDIIPIFGAFTDKRFQQSGEDLENEKRVRIKGMMVFGGGEVRN